MDGESQVMELLRAQTEEDAMATEDGSLSSMGGGGEGSSDTAGGDGSGDGAEGTSRKRKRFNKFRNVRAHVNPLNDNRFPETYGQRAAERAREGEKGGANEQATQEIDGEDLSMRERGMKTWRSMQG